MPAMGTGTPPERHFVEETKFESLSYLFMQRMRARFGQRFTSGNWTILVLLREVAMNIVRKSA